MMKGEMTYEIVFNHKRSPLTTHDKLLDNLARVDTLFGIEIRRGLIDEQHVGRDTEHETDGDSLQLTTRQGLDILVHDGFEVHRFDYVRVELGVCVVSTGPGRGMQLGLYMKQH